MASEIRVEEATEMFDGLAAAVAGLVAQLSRSASAPLPDEAGIWRLPSTGGARSDCVPAERGAREPSTIATSRPSREAANRLYRRLGFVERDSHVYRFEGPPPAD